MESEHAPQAQKQLPWPAEIISPRLLLRPLRHEDAGDVYAYASELVVSKFLSWPPHQTLGDTHDFIAWARARYQAGLPAPWALEHRRERCVIGTLALLSYSPTHALADVGYVLSPAYWGQGLVPEALAALIEHCFTVLGINRIEAQCRTNNVASSRVLIKSGLHEEALLRQRFHVGGVFYDSQLFSILREDWEQGRNS
jgi:ribosomal-protein-alanine N-acetyltransferase